MKVDQKSKADQTTGLYLAQLGASLKAHRIARRVTHQEVAQACAISRQTLSRIEKGDPSVAIGQVARYAQALGVGSKVFALKAPAAAGKRVRLTRQERARRLPAILPESKKETTA